VKRAPTRRDLLVVIGRLQDLVGMAHAGYGNDRSPDRATVVTGALDAALKLCIEVRSSDPPITGRLGPWGEP
jgi:hypothetical protein